MHFQSNVKSQCCSSTNFHWPKLVFCTVFMETQWVIFSNGYHAIIPFKDQNIFCSRCLMSYSILLLSSILSMEMGACHIPERCFILCLQIHHLLDHEKLKCQVLHYSGLKCCYLLQLFTFIICGSGWNSPSVDFGMYF